MTVGPPQTIDELIDRINASRLKILNFVDRSDEQSLTSSTDAAGWTVKDHIVHLAYWQRSISFLLRKRPRYEGLGIRKELWDDEDLEAINAELYQRSSSMEWNDARALYDTVHRELVDILRSMTMTDLMQPYSSYLPDESGDDVDNPVAFWVAGNTFGHAEMHLGWIDALLGDQQFDDGDSR